MKINVFIPHRWNNDDHERISNLLDKTKYSVNDYSITEDKALDKIDRRYNVDPQLQAQISHASVVICSNRPAINNGMALDEIKYAIAIGKPVCAVKITTSNSSEIVQLGIEIVPYRKDSIENWIYSAVNR